MKDEMTPFAEPISDETAFALSEALYRLALACEAKYFGQIRRHMATLNDDRHVDPDRPWDKNPSSE